MEVQAKEMTLTFRCPPGLEKILPQPTPAVMGLPARLRTLTQEDFRSPAGEENPAVENWTPFVDVMTYGFLIPLAIDLKVQDGEFTWDFELPKGFVSEYSHSPIDFHDPSQIAGTPFFDDDRFIIKFNNFWTIETPPGYSLLCTHPVNRTDLPFTTLTGLVDCDTFFHSPIHFPARWHDTRFNGVLPRGTPVAQCLPVKRESWTGHFDVLSGAGAARRIETQQMTQHAAGMHRRQFRARKR